MKLVLFLVQVFVGLEMSHLLVTPRKYQQRDVDSALWRSSNFLKTLSNVRSLTLCGLLCHKDLTCSAFTFDYGTKICELGPRLKPSIVDITITTYTDTSADCRNNLAKEEGYQLLEGAYYKLHHEVVPHDEAALKCEAANAKIFDNKTKAGWETFRQFIQDEPIDHKYWLEISRNLDDLRICESCPGSALLHSDGSQLSWTSQDYADWAPGMILNNVVQTCTIYFRRKHSIRDYYCDLDDDDQKVIMTVCKLEC